jgi:NitT/TauT family transport system substrate-binding protein
MTHGPRHRAGVRAFASAGIAAALVASSCAGSVSRARGTDDVLRLGLSPTLPQAPAEVALHAGILRRTLAPTRVDVTSFSTGKDAAIAMTSGAIDAAYIGPWPTAAMYEGHTPVTVVSGVASGGVSLVVRRGTGIAAAEDLHGRRIAVPSVGSTQDVELRAWLSRNGLEPREEGGDVSIAEVPSSRLLPLMRVGVIDAAWIPEPYPSYLVARGVASVLLDEASLWPSGAFASATLVVSSIYMDAHPAVVRRLVEANVAAIELIRADPARAQDAARRGLSQAGGPALDATEFREAWDNVTFTWDPLSSSVAQVARNASAFGVAQGSSRNLSGLFRLGDLRGVLQRRGLARLGDGTAAA